MRKLNEGFRAFIKNESSVNIEEPKTYDDKFEKVIGNRITVMWENGAGYWVSMNCVAKTILQVPYAQYNNALEITYKQKSGRSMLRRTIKNSKVLIFDGWIKEKNIGDYLYNNDANMSTIRKDFGEGIEGRIIEYIGKEPIIEVDTTR